MHPAVHLLSNERLREPLMIAGFESQFGATGVATILQLVAAWDAEPLADIDPEEFFDFTVRRPMVRRESDRTCIEWPTNRVYRAHVNDRDVLLFEGTEPGLRWGAFSDAIRSLCSEFGVNAVLCLGIEPGNIPHTRPRPIRLVGEFAKSCALPSFLHLEPQPDTHEGPTNIEAILTQRLADAGVETGSLQAMIPSFVHGPIDPHAALAFVHALNGAVGVECDCTALQAEAAAFDQQLTLAVQHTPALAKTVSWLEQQFDWLRPQMPSSRPALPSPADAVADVERLLESQRGQTERAE